MVTGGLFFFQEFGTALYVLDKPHLAASHFGLRPRTPAMAAGITDRVWEMQEIVGLVKA
jgi:hypothetical protein